MSEDGIIEPIGRKYLSIEERCEILAAKLRAKNREYEVTVKECD